VSALGAVFAVLIVIGLLVCIELMVIRIWKRFRVW